MQAFTQTTSFSSGGLVGVEPMPIVTFSMTLDPAQATLFAGTLIDNAGKKATTVAGALGVLAHDVTTDATDQLGATVFTSGSFLESRIKAANSALTFDAAAIADLRAKISPRLPWGKRINAFGPKISEQHANCTPYPIWRQYKTRCAS